MAMGAIKDSLPSGVMETPSWRLSSKDCNWKAALEGFQPWGDFVRRSCQASCLGRKQSAEGGLKLAQCLGRQRMPSRALHSARKGEPVPIQVCHVGTTSARCRPPDAKGCREAPFCFSTGGAENTLPRNAMPLPSQLLSQRPRGAAAKGPGSL